MNESELILGLRNGEETAFKFLVDTYQDRVYNTAMGIVQNAEDAEDVAQEVFIQVFRSIHSFKAESKLSTWIYRITTTRSLDLKENAARLFRAISQLPDNQKTAFTLHKLEDLSYQEVSEIMKTTIGAVESLMHRAKQNLRKILEKDN